MSSLINRIAELSPEKRALLLQRLNQKTENIKPIEITRQSRDSNCFPLSFAQQRLWFFDQLDPGNPTYNICSVGRVTGKLNTICASPQRFAIALEQSINEILRRHEILRTNFKVVDGQPVQVIAPSLTLTIPIIDLREIPESLREQEVQRLVNQEADRPFDLQTGSLLRVSLLHLNESEYLLVFCMHHIISDGWSAGILIQELATLYSTFARKDVAENLSTSLPELPIQYADFAVWQRQWLQGKELETQLEYWQKQLGGDLPILNLPSVSEARRRHRPRPAVQNFRGAVEKFVLPPNLTQALTQLSQQQGATLFMALLAAFNILLYRYTGQEDILVGTPIANRQRQEIEKLIGLFTNTLVMRTDLSGTPTFKDLLTRVRETALGAYKHQDLPFEKLVEVLQPNRDLSHNPIFQVLFGLRNIKMPTLELPEVTLTPEELERKTSRFDLSLDLWEEADGISGVFEYSTDLFDASTIQRMARHFQILLESIAANPDCPISTLPLLTATEQQQILVDWNNTPTDYSQNKCLHQLFEEQVEQNPDKIAVVFSDQKVTYKELNQRANQLAHYLRKLGVKPEILVGICVERSLEMLIGLLGILKAGGAYLPLDPAYPPERLALMLEDSQVRVLLTQKDLIDYLPRHNAEIVCLDNDWDLIESESFNFAPNSSNLAYVIYTSGSTGKPKGVQICHRAVVNFLNSMREKLGITATDTLLAVTSLSFDIATLELFLPLIVGARVVIASREVTIDGVRLSTSLNESGATFMQATPATWRMLLAAGWQGQKNLNILCGGEALPRELANQLLVRCDRLWNLYGPTETTIWSTICQIETEAQSITIGRPIANTQIYILDRHQQPVPVGVFGELHIGGAGLSRGYLNRAELTAEKFISNPFVNPKSERLYKTGDLARYLPDGTIEFFGRIDHQVKIRGFRIELGEIEAVLSQHPEVQQVVVIAREDNPGDKRIVAYIVPNVETLHTNSLRGFLKEKLPEYMIPSAFVGLEAIPVNTNGKIDRRALPAPDTTRHNVDSSFVAPRNPTEEIIADIWREVLGIQQVSIDDNFFDLGGHSLLATQVVSRLREAFGVELPLRYLFESPTIAGLSDAAKGGGRSQRILNNNAQKPEITLIQHVSRQNKLPLSFAQERLWFLDQLTPGDPAYNIPSAVRLQGVLNIAALEQSLNEIIKRHEVLRTSFNVVQGQPVQIIAESLALSLPVVDLQNLPATEQEQKLQQLATAEAQRSFDLTQAPLLRVTLIQLGETEYAVLFTMHHIISDRWSIGVLVRELAALYTSFSAGKPSPLTELPIQYADFAVWQRNWLETTQENGYSPLQTQLDYWKQQLGSKLPVLKFPEQLPPKPTPTFQAATQSFILPANLTTKLKALSRQENATLFMTLLAALNTLLHHYTSADDIAIGTDVANRNRADIEPLIGFFINILVLRSDLSGNPTFRQLLQQVREKSLGAYAHQDLPFNKLVELLQPERKSSQAPLFQVLFVLQNAPMPALELPGITLTPLEVGNETAKFDLVLFAEETETGIIGTWKYNTDLFECATISRLSQYFETLLASISAQPDARINTLELLTESEKMTQIQEQQQRQEANRKKFKFVKPKAVAFPQEELIKSEYFQPDQKLPLVIKPNVADIDLIDWAKNNHQFIEQELLKHGAILFREFNATAVADFENFAQAICSELFGEYGDLPREGVGGKVYGSTPYPADKAILFHNESSHMHRWPMKIWFYCVQPAQERGETPIVDCRKVYQLLDSKVRDKFSKKGLMYVRNYTNGLDVSWQDFFHTSDKLAVESFCNQNGIELEWKADGGLKTREIRQAIAKHPKTGEWLFFNQIMLHHLAYLDTSVRESLLSLFGEENLPRNVYYGDGTPIEQSVIDEITAIYKQAEVAFTWQKGDIIMLDNMLAAHARNPYVGQRKIVVAMGEIVNSKDIEIAPNISPNHEG